jgi:hypothetical protein
MENNSPLNTFISCFNFWKDFFCIPVWQLPIINPTMFHRTYSFGETVQIILWSIITCQRKGWELQVKTERNGQRVRRFRCESQHPVAVATSSAAGWNNRWYKPFLDITVSHTQFRHCVLSLRRWTNNCCYVNTLSSTSKFSCCNNPVSSSQVTACLHGSP